MCVLHAFVTLYMWIKHYLFGEILSLQEQIKTANSEQSRELWKELYRKRRKANLGLPTPLGFTSAWGSKHSLLTGGTCRKQYSKLTCFNAVNIILDEMQLNESNEVENFTN